MLLVSALKFCVYTSTVLKAFWRGLLLYQENGPIWNTWVTQKSPRLTLLHLRREFSLVFYHLLRLNDIILTAFFLKDSFFLIGWQRSKFFIAFTASLPIQGVVTYHKVYAQHVPRELALVTVPSSQSKHFTPFDILRTCEATPLVTQEKHPQFLAGLADEEISQ